MRTTGHVVLREGGGPYRTLRLAVLDIGERESMYPIPAPHPQHIGEQGSKCPMLSISYGTTVSFYSVMSDMCFRKQLGEASAESKGHARADTKGQANVNTV